MTIAPITDGGGGGGNPSGYNMTGGGTSPGSNPSLGGPMNPIGPVFPSGQNMPATDQNYYSFPANTGGTTTPAGIPNPTTSGLPTGTGDLARGLRDSGMPSDIANALASFLQSGAGYNPQVLQSIFAQMQPQIERGRANIMEQFGSMGLGMSSPAAIGLGDYYSQVALDEGMIASQLYEQSVQNYLSILTGTQSKDRGINATIQDVMKSVGDIGSLGGLLSFGGMNNGLDWSVG